MSKLKSVYTRIRQVPKLGGLISRLVWAAKGLMGRPVVVAAEPPQHYLVPPRQQSQSEAGPSNTTHESLTQPPDIQAIVWSAISSALKSRVSDLEAQLEQFDRPPLPNPAPRRLSKRRPTSGKALSFSIVINTLNRADSLRKTLQSLEWLANPRFEVIVVPGPCTDHTLAVVDEWKGRVRLAHCPEANLSMSRNIGISMAKGDVVCFIDDDAIPEPNWLDALNDAYQEGFDGVGGFIRDHSGVEFQSKIIVCDRLARSTMFESFEEANVSQAPHAPHFLSLTGTNCSFRRSALLDIGGFDEAFAYFLDETDVNVRLMDAGGVQHITELAEIHHKYAESHLRDSRRVPKSIYLPVRSTAYFCLQNSLSETDLSIIANHLIKYATDLIKDKDWYLREHYIDSSHHARLLDDIGRGLTDGIKLALEGQPRKLLSEATLAAYAQEKFQPFVARLPAQQRLKICFLSQEYPPGPVGGIGAWTKSLSEGIAALGHEVTVVTRSSAGIDTVDFETGVWVHRLVPKHFPNRLTPDLRNLPPVIADWAHTVSDEIDRIHKIRGVDVVSGPIWDVEPIGVLLSGRHRLVVSLHTTYGLALPFKPDWLSNTNYRRAHVDKVIEAEVELLTQAPSLLANSQTIVDELAALHSVDNLRARCQIAPHAARDLGQAERAERLITNNDTIKILFVGRLEPRKGADFALEAAVITVDRFPNVTFTFVGDDGIEVDGSTLHQSLKSRRPDLIAAGRIVFTGATSHEVLISHYASADIFLAPSRFESFGLIFVEAMSFGLPVVVGDISAAREIIEDRVDGRLIDLSRVDAFAECLAELIESPALRKALGHAALSKVQARYSVDSMVQQCLALYKNPVGQPTDVHPTAQATLTAPLK